MAMENALFARYVLSLVTLVEHACNFGVLGNVWDGRAECRLVKDNRYMPDDGHLVAIKFDEQDGLGSCSCCLPGICNRLQLVVLKKEEVCRNYSGRFLRAGQREACRKLALCHDETAP